MNNDLTRINLNLLMALDALLRERNVTNAGKRLFITQSAMSNSLKQLREIFNDELFIRGQASRLIPTRLALALTPQVEEAIEKLTCLFNKTESFNPQEAKLTFTIGLSDYTEFLFLAPLIKCLLKEAPGINILVKNITYIDSAKPFELEEIDMVVGIFKSTPASLMSVCLFEDSVVCMGAKDNPIFDKPISKKKFAEAKHLVVLYTETRAQLLSEQLIKELGYERKAIVTVPNTLPALSVLIDTDLISLVMKKIACQYCNKSKYGYQSLEFDIPAVPVSLVWHPIHENNAAHKWIRDKIIEISQKI